MTKQEHEENVDVIQVFVTGVLVGVIIGVVIMLMV